MASVTEEAAPSRGGSLIRERLESLKDQLRAENSVLVSVVQSFNQLDEVGRALGFLKENESYATRIPWWPLISIMGTFSAGKSSFINHYLGHSIQRSGNQAVDDRFTVICYSREKDVRTLPGVALDADLRFPFYQISREIEKVAKGEGARVDAYVQMKTCPSPKIRGRIIIDSPGFDADAQRTSTLRITDYMVELSDLVLVFFDARHPEPGAMRDTLDHLVARSMARPDSGKFLYILNQLDTTAREDNPEEVVAAWQRALAEKGLTAGRFFTIYNPDIAVAIENENLRQRFESKRDADLAEITQRIDEVSVSRAYRIVGNLESTSRQINDDVETLREARGAWRSRVLWTEIIVWSILFVGLLVGSVAARYWNGLVFSPPWLEEFKQSMALKIGAGLAALGLLLLIHFAIRKITAGLSARQIEAAERLKGNTPRLSHAFRENARWWRTLLRSTPKGWDRRAQERVEETIRDCDQYVQELNDHFTNPSGT